MVPDYVEKAGRLSKSAVYNVIIITRLFYYKPKGLKESDVVQFTVSSFYFSLLEVMKMCKLLPIYLLFYVLFG